MWKNTPTALGIAFATVAALPLVSDANDGATETEPAKIVMSQASDGLTMGELLDTARDVLDIDFFFVHENDLNTELPIYGTPEVAQEDFLVFFERTLRQADYLHIVMDDCHAIRRTTGQGGRGTSLFKALAPVVSPAQADEMRNRVTLITTHYVTKNIPARDAVNTLQPYFGDNFTDNIRNIEGTNAIIMTGFSNTIGGVLDLLKEIDTVSDVDPKATGRAPTMKSMSDRVGRLESKIDALMGALSDK